MKTFINIILYISTALLVLQNHLLLAAALAVIFTFRVNAVWLIVLSVAIDGYFGAFYSLPLFSLVSIFWYVVSEYLRPLLVVQYKQYA